MPNFRRFTELPGNPYRLGRHQVHDALDPARAAVVDHTDPIRTVTHKELLPVFDQGQLGSCTANAALGTLVTEPYAKPGVAFTEADAVTLYRLETKLDDSQIPGQYPPADTGSTGPWSMQALEKEGLISSFRHTTDVPTALRMLNDGPISVGIPWFQSMFTPTEDGYIKVDASSGLAGGHQVAITANDAEGKRVLVRNSWGSSWANDGRAWLTWTDLQALFDDGGDCVQPIV